MEVTSEAGKASFGFLVVVPPGEERTVSLCYTLPRYILDDQASEPTYRLYIQKQSGTTGAQATVSVRVPEGSGTIASSQSTEWEQPSRKEAVCERALDSDLRFELSWRPAGR